MLRVVANDQVEEREETRECNNGDYEKNPDYVSERAQKVPCRVVCVVTCDMKK